MLNHRLFILLFLLNLIEGFSPNENDPNAYGIKMSMNEILFVQVNNENNPPRFLIQFGPYNNSRSSIQCTISTSNLIDHFVYTVTTRPNQSDFIFIGELINERNGTFIGMAKFNQNSSTCENSFIFILEYFDQYKHEEFYLIDVEPKGQYVYGFSNQFVYIYDCQMNLIRNLWNGSMIWLDSSFLPHSVDLSDDFGVIVGFIRNPSDTVTVYIPIIYLINFNSSNRNPIIVDQYLPNATSNTWQDLLTNADANVYSAKYEMSVDINENGFILVGMQFLNRVFFLSVNKTKPMKFNYISRNTNGRSLGNGKSVVWLNNSQAAILVNSYTLTYQWLSSSIYIYDIENGIYNSNSTPLSTFPNTHQLLPLSFSLILVSLVSSRSSLALMDNRGNVLIFNSISAGYYPFIEDIGSNPILTSPRKCLSGTYKNQSGIHDCLLCPTGCKNPGNSSLECLRCLSDSFCSLGSVNDVPLSTLDNIIQVFPYPKSPESIIFDEILIENIFFIGKDRCLVISPLFWTLIVVSLAILVIIMMAILKICLVHSRAKLIREKLKCIFRHLDLINEGESWIGGLASIPVIVLVSFAYSFSHQFLKQYPLEETSNSYFACDLSLRNAKFETSLQSSSIQRTESEQKMFQLLSDQNLSLKVDFINTIIDCSAVSLQALFGTTWNVIRWDTCLNNQSILSLTIPLPYQQISVQILIADIQIIGALRIGLVGEGSKSEHYELRQLNFRQSFYKMGQILAQNLSVILDLTKVINETYPMIGEEADYKGIYIPTFIIDPNSLFLSASQYIRLSSNSIQFQIDIHETPYYVKNVQRPIAKRPEVIFHNLLFTILCLEIFGLGFLLYKLIIKPIGHLLCPQHFETKENEKEIIDENNQKVIYF